MKTILVPLDFSAVSNNAVRYAFKLSKELDARIILFNAYHRPFLLSSLALITAKETLEKRFLDALQAEEYNCKHITGIDAETESIVYKGEPLDGILDVLMKREIDYIVMGITGSSLLPDVLIGSTTISVIQETKIPVFVIPKNAKFKKIERFVFVHNFSEPIPENVSKEIKMFCQKFQSELIIYGRPRMEVVGTTKEINSLEMEFEGSGVPKVDHALTFSDDDDLPDEINSFADFSDADLIAMTPNESKLFRDIFKRDNTSVMAFHTHLPLLIMPRRK